ncbi:MAG: PilZ domain-containing protein [Candidatus Acidiferrales bacterium]
MAGFDKRIMPRLPVSAGNYVIYTEGSGGIRDISLGGVFIEDSAPLSEGTVFSFDLRLGNTDVPVRGVVRRMVPGVGMGVQFQNLPPATQTRLERFLASMEGAKKSASPSSKPKR